MTPEEQKEFIDALEERVYVIVETFYGNTEPRIISPRYTQKEMVEQLKEKMDEYKYGFLPRSVYVAHYKNLDQPVGRQGFI